MTVGSGGDSIDFPMDLSPAPIEHDDSASPPTIPDGGISPVRF